jgi:hypothetical protein
MKRYTFFYDYQSEGTIYEDAINRSTELEITYSILSGEIILQTVKMNTYGQSQIDVLPAIECNIKWLCENHQAMLSIQQMYNNYPHLAKTPTLEDKIEMLKIK